MKFRYIDSLRGIAVLGVLLVHFGSYFIDYLPGIIDNVIYNGARGVQLFFFASAFTLYFSFQNRLQKEKYPIRNFFIRRFFRIAPMYYIGILIYTLFINSKSSDIFDILCNIFFVHGFFPTAINSVVPGGWSIGVEMAFYCILPILFFLINNLSRAFWFFNFTLMFRVVLHILFKKYSLISDTFLWQEFLSLYLPSQLPIFALGILFYFIVFEDDIKKKTGSRFLASGLLVLFILVSVDLLTQKFIFLNTHILFGFSFLLLAIGLQQYPIKIIVNKFTEHIGKLSYSIYLVHFAILYLFRYFGLENILIQQGTSARFVIFGFGFLLLLVTSIIISTLTYHTIERYGQKLGQKLIIYLEKNE